MADQLPPPPLTKKERQEKKGKVNTFETRPNRLEGPEKKKMMESNSREGRASKTKYGEKEMLPFIPVDEVRSVNASSSLSPSREK